MHKNRMQKFDPAMDAGDHIMRAVDEKTILLRCGFEPTECLLIHVNGLPFITIKRRPRARQRGK